MKYSRYTTIFRAKDSVTGHLPTISFYIYGTAFRRREGCYLENKNVDFKEKTISVRSTEEHKLKTDASSSDIPMTDHATIALKDQIKNKMGHQKEVVRRSTYIFCNFRGEHYYPATLTKQVIKRVKAVCKDLGINSSGVDLHSMRHSLIQHLIDSGAEPVTVSKFARHANLSTTLSAYHKMSDTKTKFESVLKVTKEMPRPHKKNRNMKYIPVCQYRNRMNYFNISTFRVTTSLPA